MFSSHRVCLLLLVVSTHLFCKMEETLAEDGFNPVEDVSLNAEGLFFCGMSGNDLQEKIIVRIYQDGKLVGQTQTNSQQAFAFSGLRPGTYQISWDSPRGNYNTKVLRIWNQEQAPPIAKDYIVLPNTPQQVVRGQYGSNGSTEPSGTQRIFRNPWISAAIISTAIAVPIAVAYKDRYRDGS